MATTTEVAACVMENDRLVCRDTVAALTKPMTMERFSAITFRDRPVCGVYKIECVPTGSIYVGESWNVVQRLRTHCRNFLAVAGALGGPGLDGFRVSLLEECTQETVGEREAHWIAMLRPTMNQTPVKQRPPHPEQFACMKCRRYRRIKGERFCRTCRKTVIAEMRASGYLPKRMHIRQRRADPDKSLPRRNMPWDG